MNVGLRCTQEPFASRPSAKALALGELICAQATKGDPSGLMTDSPNGTLGEQYELG